MKIVRLKKLLVLFVVATLAACAFPTKEGYEELLNQLNGCPEETLISAMGVPSSVYESGGVKYLTYIRSSSGYVPGTAPTYQTTLSGNTAYTTQVGGSPGFFYTNRCETTFMVVGGIVQGYRFQGNACKAHSPSSRPRKGIVDTIVDMFTSEESQRERREERRKASEEETRLLLEKVEMLTGEKLE